MIGNDKNVLVTGLTRTVHGPVLFVLHQTVYALEFVPGLQLRVIVPFEAAMFVIEKVGSGTKVSRAETFIGLPRLSTCSWCLGDLMTRPRTARASSVLTLLINLHYKRIAVSV